MTEQEFEEKKAICKDLFLYYAIKTEEEIGVDTFRNILRQIDVILDMYLDLVKKEKQ